MIKIWKNILLTLCHKSQKNEKKINVSRQQVRRRLKYRRGVADRRKSATLLIPVGGEEEEGEGGGVLFGPKITGVRKDRRRAHIREADDRLDEVGKGVLCLKEYKRLHIL